MESKDNFKLGYGWFGKAVKLVDEGAGRIAGGTSNEIRYVDATPHERGLDDIAFRSMPAMPQTHLVRFRPGEDEHLRHRGDVRGSCQK